MAQVAQDADTQASIEHFLGYAFHEWSAVPSYRRQFETWDDVQQLTFLHEWAIRESALEALRSYAEQGILSDAQVRRYDEILRVVARNRPMIEQLLKG